MAFPENDHIRIAGLNVNGLLGKLRLGILDIFIEDIDILCICETKLYSYDNDYVQSLLPNHKALLMPEKRDGRRGGTHGLAIFVNERLQGNVTPNEDPELCEHVMWVRVVLDAYVSFVLGSVYIPHEGSIHFDDEWHSNISADLIALGKLSLPFMLVGDFNSRTGTLDDFMEYDENIARECGLNTDDDLLVLEPALPDCLGPGRVNQDRRINNNGRRLTEICQIFNMHIANGRLGSDRGVGEFTCHTSQGDSTVDYIIMSSELLSIVTDFVVGDYDSCLSDVHRPLCLTLIAEQRDASNEYTIEENSEIYPASAPSDNRFHQRHRIKWVPGSATRYQEGFVGITKPLEDLLTRFEDKLLVGSFDDSDADELSRGIADGFTRPASISGISNVTNGTNPKRRPKKPHKPWFNEECKAKRQDYLELKNRSKKIATIELKLMLKQAAKEYKKLIKSTARAYYDGIHASLRNLKSNNPREYWQKVNRCSQSEKQHCQCSLDELAQHFKDLNVNVAPTLAPGSEIDLNQADPILNQPFTTEEIHKIVQSLKNNKAPGVDGVINEFIKHCPREMLSILTRWFNIVLESGKAPNDWCMGIISPIYKKKGSKSSPDNYRGITLLSCMGKLFTNAINKRLTNLIEQERIIGPEQAGFRTHHSTMDHVFSLHSIVDYYLASHKRVYAAFLDYRKAFDMVDRVSLWQKVLDYGLSGKILRVVMNIYSKAKSCVKTYQGTSEAFPSATGVRQGENLSPLLFALYINDFKDYVRSKYPGLPTLENLAVAEGFNSTPLAKLGVMLYADDTLLLSETEEDLQRALDATGEYCKKWSIAINPSKSKIVVFSRGKVRNIPRLTLNRTELEVTFDFTYLGICFDYKNGFKKAIAKQTQHATKALHALMTKVSCLELPLDIQFDLFEHTIIPILLYGSEVWGFENAKMTEVFQRKFLKRRMHLRKSTPNAIVYGESGMMPTHCSTDQRLLNFWLKLHAQPDSEQSFFPDKLSCSLYQLSRRLWDRGARENKWLNNVKQKLDHLGLGWVWESPAENTMINPKWFKEALKLRISDVFVQGWRSELVENKQCKLYAKLKDAPKLEKPLCQLNMSTTIPILRFCCGNLAFPSNYYLRKDPQRTQACDLCGFVLGDELHYLLSCPDLTNLRVQYIHQRYIDKPSAGSLACLIHSRDEKELHRLAKFIHHINKMLVR